MAFNFLIRSRSAATCSMIPLLRRSVENPCFLGVPFLRFSSSTTATYANDNNIAKLIEIDRSVQADVTTVADRTDFKVEHDSHPAYDFCVTKESEDEEIWVSICNPVGEDPVREIDVAIQRENENLTFSLLAKPHQFKVHSLSMTGNEVDEHLECFEEFFKSKGVNSSMINMLFNHFGVEPKKINNTMNG